MKDGDGGATFCSQADLPVINQTRIALVQSRIANCLQCSFGAGQPCQNCAAPDIFSLSSTGDGSCDNHRPLMQLLFHLEVPYYSTEKLLSIPFSEFEKVLADAVTTSGAWESGLFLLDIYNVADDTDRPPMESSRRLSRLRSPSVLAPTPPPTPKPTSGPTPTPGPTPKPGPAPPVKLIRWTLETALSLHVDPARVDVAQRFKEKQAKLQQTLKEGFGKLIGDPWDLVWAQVGENDLTLFCPGMQLMVDENGKKTTSTSCPTSLDWGFVLLIVIIIVTAVSLAIGLALRCFRNWSRDGLQTPSVVGRWNPVRDRTEASRDSGLPPLPTADLRVQLSTSQDELPQPGLATSWRDYGAGEQEPSDAREPKVISMQHSDHSREQSATSFASTE